MQSNSSLHRFRPWLIALALATLCAIAYFNSLKTSFHFDDYRLIRFNFSLRDPSNWKNIFNYEAYRPLLVASFALNYQLTQQNPVSYHVLNVLLHFTAVILFYLFLRRFSQSELLPALAAAFMAVHPLNTEAVTYIAGRGIVICSIFYFAALLFFDSYLKKGGWLRAGYFASFLLAAMAKEEAAMIPFTALLYNILIHRESVRQHRAFHALSLLLLSAGVVLRFLKPIPASPITFDAYLLTEVNVWLRYLLLALYPVGLNVSPDIPQITLAHFQFWLSAVAVAAILLAFWKLRNRIPFVSFWGIWIFLNFLPSSVLPLNDLMAEHRAYLSVFGFCALLSYALIAVWKPRAKPVWVVFAVTIVMIAFCTFATVERNRVWRSEYTLWSDAVNKSPHSIRPHMNLAGAYIQRRAYGLAIEQYFEAVQLGGNDAQIYSGLGIAYLQLGDLITAEKYFRAGMKAKPHQIDCQTGLGLTLHRMHQYREALPYLIASYPSRQESPLVVWAISDCYLQTKQYEQAIDFLWRGTALDAKNKQWYPRLMEAYFRARHPDEALAVYDRHRNEFPSDSGTSLVVAQILHQLGRTKEAIPILQRLLKDPNVSKAAAFLLKRMQ